MSRTFASNLVVSGAAVWKAFLLEGQSSFSPASPNAPFAVLWSTVTQRWGN